MAEIPSTEISEREKPGAKIMARLEKLRSAHRLGLHVWEHNYGDSGRQDPDGPFYPHVTSNLLAMWHLPPEQRPTLSISVLPAASDRASMEPWQCGSGYLLDLSEQNADPAISIAGTKTVMGAGEDPFHKHIDYGAKGVTIDQMIKQCKKHHDNVWPTNEMLMQLGKHHVVALGFSICGTDDVDSANLAAALMGLEHARNGQPIPPVVLNVAYLDPPGAQSLIYLGDTKEELRRVATRAAKDLIASGKNYLNYNYWSHGTDKAEQYLWDSFEKNVGLSKNDLLRQMGRASEVRDDAAIIR